MSALNVAIRVDASAQIGTGHLTRCQTLAKELQSRGGRVHFLSRHLTDFQQSQILAAGHDLTQLDASQDGSDNALMHGAPQIRDAAVTARSLTSRMDWLVVDHYALDAEWEQEIRPWAKALLVIDDLADRRHDCDMLLDQNITETQVDRYAELTPETCQKLTGPRYALLRPEFLGNICIPLESRRAINLFFGGADLGGITLKAITALAIAGINLKVDIVVGADNPHRAAIVDAATALPNSEVHVQPERISSLFGRTLLAVGAGGVTALERCVTQTPTLLVSIADNQKASCRALAMAGAAEYIGEAHDVSAEQIAIAVSRLVKDRDRLLEMSHRTAAITDGRGTERVVDAMAVKMRRFKV